ncbi:MAG: asparagine synthase (glutamine-hydrolyzing) [Chitinophagales bacterium]|nr:asparagine synthase (glutamine-hydrolyzing) [Chitinophagales bacterium]
MCGIFGITKKDKKSSIDTDVVADAIAAVAHRGPDHQAVQQIAPNIVFAHARLSIIDVHESSHQPFSFEHYTVVFNGEIFNYIEIRKQLIELGYSFKTKSDTEVLLAAYDAWRSNCVDHFNGMWAFAIYDHLKEELFCSRDRFGIKPFVYYATEDTFIFASEIKSILTYDSSLKQVNYAAIASYLKESVGAEIEQTWFSKIKRLQPGHNLYIKNGQITRKQYWDYPKTQDKTYSQQTISTFYNTLRKAVNVRLRSDVPLGVTLSSGLDSSIITKLASEQVTHPLKCYTAAFPNYPLDEYPEALKFAKTLNVKHIPVYPSYNQLTPVLKKIIYHLESGHSSPAIFPLYYIAQEAKKDITVVLEGQGADELLGGYIEKNIITVLLEYIVRLKLFTFIKSFKTFYKRYNIKGAFILYMRGINIPFINKWLRLLFQYENIYDANIKNQPVINSSKGIKRLVNLNASLIDQHKRGLVNLLHYGDAISMIFSLENRVPFLDYRLVEYVFKLPTKAKVNNGYGKNILRIAFKESISSSIINNTTKKGFPSPISQFFQNDSDAIQILLSNKFKNRQIIKPEALQKLITEHQSAIKDNSRLLFRLLSAELWFQTFID